MSLSKLRLARLNEELTLIDLWRRTGIATSRLSLLERGLVEVRDEEKKLLADYFGSTVEDLFPSPVTAPV